MFFKWRPFAEADAQKIIKAIDDAEKKTSGEIRVHIDKYCKNDPLLKAKNIFSNLKMDQTKQRNAVLIYISFLDKKFAIWGDEGINKVVPEGFWDQTAHLLKGHFASNQMIEGIVQAILNTGTILKQHFPYHNDDKNELPNTISY